MPATEKCARTGNTLRWESTVEDRAEGMVRSDRIACYRVDVFGAVVGSACQVPAIGC